MPVDGGPGVSFGKDHRCPANHRPADRDLDMAVADGADGRTGRPLQPSLHQLLEPGSLACRRPACSALRLMIWPRVKVLPAGAARRTRSGSKPNLLEGDGGLVVHLQRERQPARSSSWSREAQPDTITRQGSDVRLSRSMHPCCEVPLLVPRDGLEPN